MIASPLMPATLPGSESETARRLRIGCTVTTTRSSSVETIAAADGAFGELRPENGEIALSTASGNLEAKDFLIYLQWGSTPHKLTKRAIQAGLWVEGGYAPTSAGATRLFRVAETGLWLFDE